MLNALCFDVDDLAYCLNMVKGLRLPVSYLVEQESYVLLEALDQMGVRATLFVPGYVARRFPSLIQEMDRAGHELASHGDRHLRVEQLGPAGFQEDVQTGKKILEDIIGKEVTTFRAPDWSISPQTVWAYDQLTAVGFRVDHSALPRLLPALGRQPWDGRPFRYQGGLWVIPVTSIRLWGRVFPLSGGMYNAYIPIALQLHYLKKINAQGLPFSYYCHPYEFHPTGLNRRPWRYRSWRAAFYGLHFGRYRGYLERIAARFPLAPLGAAYARFVSPES